MKSFFLFSTFLLTCLTVSLTSSTNAFSQQANLFHQANQAYDQADYSKALELYQTLYKTQGESGVLNFNLGNTYYRLGKIGESIFFLRKAQDLLPRNADVAYNLKYIRGKAIDNIKSDQETVLSKLARFFPFNLKEGFVILLISSLLFWGVHFVLLFKQLRPLQALKTPFLLIYGSIVLLASAKFLPQKDFGVINYPEVKVYSATGKDNVALFELHEGTEFDVLEKDELSWVKIILEDAQGNLKKGWIKNQWAIINSLSGR